MREHLGVLRELSPTWASFYILCPIPGTEQYDDFRAQGLITERNLDRFDTTCLTWRHPNFTPERLSSLLFASYRQFFSLSHALQNVKDETRVNRPSLVRRAVGSLAMSLFSRYSAARQCHPMSGGIRRVRLDRADDYLRLRQQTYGFALAPLPESLPVPVAEIDRSRSVSAVLTKG